MFVEWHKNRTWRSLHNVVVNEMPLRVTSNCNWSHESSIDLYINSIVSIAEQYIVMNSFFAMRACTNNRSMSLPKFYEASTCLWSLMQLNFGLYNFMIKKILQFYLSQRRFYCTFLVTQTRNVFIDIDFTWCNKQLNVLSFRSGCQLWIAKHFPFVVIFPSIYYILVPLLLNAPCNSY